MVGRPPNPVLKIEPEFQGVYDTWKATPTPEATTAFLDATSPIIDSAVRSYAVGAPSPLLRSKARKLTVEALHSYDPQQGPLKPHLMSRLQRLRRISGQQQQIIRIPEDISLQRIRMGEAATELEEELGRPPSSAELADRLGVPMRRLQLLQRAQRPSAEGFFDQMGGEEDSGGFAPATQSLADGQGDQWLEFVFDDLGPRDQYIMEHAMGMHGNKPTPLTQIARRLKVTPSAVSQRLKQIQSMLDARPQDFL